jgi:hypothetical protein
MSDNQNLGFGKFVPGFDFLQNLAKGASQTIPQMPNLANWVAPTLNVEELEKRITDLKAVHFWLDQNSKALGATIQALEVQKMTLATLQGMNFNMGDLANALKLKATDSVAAGVQKATETAAGAAGAVSGAARSKASVQDGKPATGVVDPLQWWGSLTQQFQQIASDAMKDAARNTAVDTAKNMGTAMTKTAMKSATNLMRTAAPGSGAKPARKAAKAPRKTAARKPRA